MKRTIVLVAVLLLAAGLAFSLDVGGSTQVAGIGNPDQQRLEIDQEVDIDLGALHFDLNGGTDYNFVGKDLFWDFDVGGSYTLGVLKFGGSIVGNQDIHLTDIKGFVDLTLGDAGADFDILCSADDAKDFFQGFDISAFYNTGPFAFRVGYLYTDVALPDINAPELLTDGGIYAKVKVTY